ncbi:Mitochondrial ATPase expression domain containing protein [Hyaloscypha variabilis]
MSTLLLKFEAIESRIASYSCPRGIPGRVHALRLRRWQNNNRRQSVAVGERLPAHERESRIDSASETVTEDGDAIGGPGSSVGQRKETRKETRDEAQQIPKPPVRDGAIGLKVGASHTWRRLERWFEPPLGAQAQGDMFRPLLNKDGIDDPTEHEAAVYLALRTGNPHIVLKALSDHAKTVGFYNTRSLLVSMPPSTFSEALRSLDPKHFVGRYQEFHMQLSPRLAKKLGLLDAISLQGGYYKFCITFLEQVKSILEARHLEHPPALSDYKYLFRCARATGNRNLAEYLWKKLTVRNESDKVTEKLPAPDLDCYNSLLWIKCWNDTTNPLLRYRLRVIPENFAPRTWEHPPYALTGHSVAQGSSIRAQVALHFRSMVEAGISGNEETFCLMIVSNAREGEMSAVASILGRVWNIDLQELLTLNDSELPPPKAYRRHSPFHPTGMLLYTIAHAFGINNQIPTALRLIDYISSRYSIPIPTNVWNELLTWTFVLSIRPRVRKRQGEVVDTGKDIGQLPPEAVTNLWDTMVSKPYNVKPTREMYDRLITNLCSRQRYREMHIRMEEARRVLKDDIRKLSRMQATFNATTRQHSPTHLAEQRMRDLILARLRIRRNRKYIERWVKLLILRGSRSLKYTDGWSDRNLPNIVKNWSLFLPEKLRYEIRSGYVSFKSGSKEERILRYSTKISRSSRLERKGLRQRKGKKFGLANSRWPVSPDGEETGDERRLVEESVFVNDELR